MLPPCTLGYKGFIDCHCIHKTSFKIRIKKCNPSFPIEGTHSTLQNENCFYQRDVAELLTNHIQAPIEMNNLCSTSDKKLSVKLGIYFFGLLQNMQIVIIQKLNVSFPSFFAHAPTMCKYFFERCLIFPKGRLQMDFLSIQDSAQHSGSAI